MLNFIPISANFDLAKTWQRTALASSAVRSLRSLRSLPDCVNLFAQSRPDYGLNNVAECTLDCD